MKKLPFVCSGNKLRSPTAEAMLSECKNIAAIDAGLNKDAEVPVSN